MPEQKCIQTYIFVFFYQQNRHKKVVQICKQTNWTNKRVKKKGSLVAVTLAECESDKSLHEFCICVF